MLVLLVLLVLLLLRSRAAVPVDDALLALCPAPVFFFLLLLLLLLLLVLVLLVVPVDPEALEGRERGSSTRGFGLSDGLWPDRDLGAGNGVFAFDFDVAAVAVASLLVLMLLVLALLLALLVARPPLPPAAAAVAAAGVVRERGPAAGLAVDRFAGDATAAVDDDADDGADELDFLRRLEPPVLFDVRGDDDDDDADDDADDADEVDVVRAFLARGPGTGRRTPLLLLLLAPDEPGRLPPVARFVLLVLLVEEAGEEEVLLVLAAGFGRATLALGERAALDGRFVGDAGCWCWCWCWCAFRVFGGGGGLVERFATGAAFTCSAAYACRDAVIGMGSGLPSPGLLASLAPPVSCPCPCCPCCCCCSCCCCSCTEATTDAMDGGMGEEDASGAAGPLEARGLRAELAWSSLPLPPDGCGVRERRGGGACDGGGGWRRAPSGERGVGGLVVLRLLLPLVVDVPCLAAPGFRGSGGRGGELRPVLFRSEAAPAWQRGYKQINNWVVGGGGSRGEASGLLFNFKQLFKLLFNFKWLLKATV